MGARFVAAARFCPARGALPWRLRGCVSSGQQMWPACCPPGGHELTSAVFLSVQISMQAPTLPAVPELPEVKIPGLSEFKASVAAACTPALLASCCVAP